MNWQITFFKRTSYFKLRNRYPDHGLVNIHSSFSTTQDLTSTSLSDDCLPHHQAANSNTTAPQAKAANIFINFKHLHLHFLVPSQQYCQKVLLIEPTPTIVSLLQMLSSKIGWRHSTIQHEHYRRLSNDPTGTQISRTPVVIVHAIDNDAAAGTRIDKLSPAKIDAVMRRTRFIRWKIH